MTFRSDIVLRDAQGRPTAAIEIKNREKLSRDVAVALRQGMIAHGLLPDLPYFLILSQDVGYLWKKTAKPRPKATPNYEFPMDRVVSRYLPARLPAARLRTAQLELVVLQWLAELSVLPQHSIEEPEKSLSDSGFLDSIRGAAITTEWAI